MNKDFIVSLLRKDIDELQTLTEGFEQLTVFPEPILRLAIQKAENITKSLHSLGQNLEEEPVVLDDESVEIQDFVTEAEAADLEEKNDFASSFDTIEEKTKDTVLEDLEKETEKLLDEAALLSEGRVETTLGLDMESAKREEFQEEVEVEELSENEDNIISYPIQKELKESIRTEPKEAITKKQIETAEELSPQGKYSLNDKLQQQGTQSLSDNLANQKINDIRLAMNIGDRFRFQRELFAGNGEVMNKTIAYLNQLAKYEEAESFLTSKFNWDKDNPHAEEFLQLIRKRYL